MVRDNFIICSEQHKNCSAMNELKQYRQWVVWKKKWEDGKPTKPPYDPKTGKFARSNDSSTWGSFDEAMSAFNSQEYDGIGFVFTDSDPFCGVDLDHCYSDGILQPWAQESIDLLDSYTEISPSGDGIHILTKGQIPRGGNKRELSGTDGNNGIFEIYKTGRYFTVTMNVFSKERLEIRDRPDALFNLFNKYIGVRKSLPEKSLHQAIQPENSADWDGRIDQLLISEEVKSLITLGEEKGDRSEAIMKVLNGLVKTGSNDEQILDIFEKYPIGEKYREKGVQRSEWLKRQIKKARETLWETRVNDTEWEEPIPFSSPEETPRDFPVDALPSVIREAVQSYQAYGKQPMALVAFSALASVSLACQGLADVARDYHLTGPISLYLMAVAESGERKTAADTMFTKPIREWQKQRAKELRSALLKNKREREFWEKKCKKLTDECEKIKLGIQEISDGRDLEAIEAEIEKLERNPVPAIHVPSFFYEDSTPQALTEGIAKGYPSASIWSDEGALVIGSHGMKKDSVMNYFGLLNRCWDANESRIDRKTGESFYIAGKRLTCNLMLQETVLSALVNDNDKLSRGVGLLARFLISKPVSTMGTRTYTSECNWEALNKFHNRIFQLLDIKMNINDDGELNPPVLQLSAGARKAWIDFYNFTECSLLPNGKYTQVKDFASKIADNAARIAGCFHVFEYGPTGMISEDTIKAATEIAHWSLDEARRIMTKTDKPKSVSDAEKLLEWIRQRGTETIKPAEISQLGPSSIRTKPPRDKAIEVLVNSNYLKWKQNGNASTLKVNPSLA